MTQGGKQANESLVSYHRCALDRISTKRHVRGVAVRLRRCNLVNPRRFQTNKQIRIVSFRYHIKKISRDQFYDLTTTHIARAHLIQHLFNLKVTESTIVEKDCIKKRLHQPFLSALMSLRGHNAYCKNAVQFYKITCHCALVCINRQ